MAATPITRRSSSGVVGSRRSHCAMGWRGRAPGSRTSGRGSIVESMRLCQNAGISPAYRRRLAVITRDAHTFDEHVSAFLADRYGACHFLQPVLERQASAFFTNGDDEGAQRAWAREHGLPASTDLGAILMAQI